MLIKNLGKSSRGRNQGLPKIVRAPIYRAHRAVIFAIAQLSCRSNATEIILTAATRLTDKKAQLPQR